MSNDEYTHRNFWKKAPKFLTTMEGDIRVHFISNPFFDEPFCKQIKKKKKHDKTV